MCALSIAVELGRGEFIGDGSLPAARAHFSLWCIMKSPLLLGNDLTAIDEYTLGEQLPIRSAWMRLRSAI